jgi:hypothetical protein
MSPDASFGPDVRVWQTEKIAARRQGTTWKVVCDSPGALALVRAGESFVYPSSSILKP